MFSYANSSLIITDASNCFWLSTSWLFYPGFVRYWSADGFSTTIQ